MHAPRVRFSPVVLLCCLAFVQPLLAASFQLQEPGFQFTELAHDCSGGMDFLPNGDLVCLDGTRIFAFDGNGDGTPAGEQTLWTLPVGGVFGDFVRVSPSGQRLLAGESSTGAIYLVQPADGTGRQVTTLPFNFDAAFLTNDQVVISATPDGTTTKLYQLDLTTDALRVIGEVNGPSGPVVFDDAGNLYYIRSTYDFPAPPGSHALLQFANSDVAQALGGSRVLGEADAQVVATLDGGFNLLVNSFGDVFASDFAGVVRRIQLDGGVNIFAQATDGFALITYAAIYQPYRRFQPYQDSLSRLAFFVDDFSVKRVVLVGPQRDDPFADQVIGYAPGPGQFTGNPSYNDPQRALGSPVGGGTVSADQSSQVTLGDGGSLTLKVLAPVRDDAQHLHGLDLSIFSNAFWRSNDPRNRWTEPAYLEASQDMNHNGLPDDPWFLVLPEPLPAVLAQQGPAQYSALTLRQYADYSPTLQLGDMNGDNDTTDPGDQPSIAPADFYTVPDRLSFDGDDESFRVDAGSGGGDGFDLREAVVESSPGVPLMDGAGQLRRVFLDRVHFLRLTDAVTGDTLFPVGEISAEIDAVADARSRILGRRLDAANAAQLAAAVAQALPGDEVAVAPGVYRLTTPLALPPGVSLVGPSGLWTPNVPGDDAVLDCSGISYPPGSVEAAVILQPGASLPTPQGYEITGLHFAACRTAIHVEGWSPVIQHNLFTDCLTAIHAMNGTADLVIRGNLFGHRSAGLPETGVRAENLPVALVHNTFVRHDQAAVSLDNAAAYLRDNIFTGNRLAVRQMGSAALYGQHNVVFGNTSDYALAGGTIEQPIVLDPAFAFPDKGDYRLAAVSAVRGQGLGGGDPGLYDGPGFVPFNVALDDVLPEPPANLTAQLSGTVASLAWSASTSDDVAGYRVYRSAQINTGFTAISGTGLVSGTIYQDATVNTSTTSYYAVTAVDNAGNESARSNIVAVGPTAPFIVNLTVAPLVNTQSLDFSGATAAKMLLDYLGSIQPLQTLYAYATARNLPENGGQTFVDPQGLQGTLNAFHPAGYNFGILPRTTAAETLRDISFWLSFHVPNVAPDQVPGIIPTAGDYRHWMLVKGVVASDDPQRSAAYDVIGLWLHDPAVAGLGANSFTTAEEAVQTYLLPITHPDRFQGRFVAVLEPPTQEAAVRVVRAKRRLADVTWDATLTGGTLTGITPRRWRAVQRAAAAALQEEVAVYDEELAGLLNALRVRRPYLVEGSGGPFYLVPMRRPTGTQVVVILDAQDGHLKAASWTAVPQRYLPVSRTQAVRWGVRALRQTRGWRRRTDRSPFRIRLVHQPGGSPYYPDWEVTLRGLTARISQQGTVTVVGNP